MVLVVLCVLLGIGLGAFVWRVHKEPLDVAFIKPTIEQALHDSGTGIHPKFERVVLHWPDLSGPLLLGLIGTKVYNADQTVILSVPEAAISFNKAKLLIGQLSPEILILRRPALRVVRGADNHFDFGFESEQLEQKPENSEAQENLTAIILRMLARPNSTGEDVGPLADLKKFQIDSARVVVDDHVLGFSWLLPRADALLQSTQTGLLAKYSIDLPISQAFLEAPRSVLKGDFSYDWETKHSSISAKLTNFQLGLLAEKMPQLELFKNQSAPLDVGVEVSFDDSFGVVSAKAIMVSDGGELVLPEVSEEPIAYKNFGVQMEYDGASQTYTLKALSANVRDIPILVQASVVNVEGTYKAKGSAKIDEVAQAQIPPLWPKSLNDESAKEWLVDKMSEGVFKNVVADFEVSAQRNEAGAFNLGVDALKATLDYEGLTVDYRAPLAAVKDAKGSVTFDYTAELMGVEVESATIGGLSVESAEVKLSKIIEAGAGVADIDIKLRGPLKSALEYIAPEPIGVKPDVDVAKVSGEASIIANINFPTKKDLLVEDIKLSVKGEMRDTVIPGVIKDLELTGGPFAVAVKGNDFTLSGKGQLGGRPIDLQYSEFLNSEGQAYSSKVEAKIEADDDLRSRMGIDLSDFLAGAADLSVVYTKKPDGSAVADVIATLNKARLFFEPIAYEKSIGEEGSTSFKAYLKDDILYEIADLSAKGPGLQIETSKFGFRENNGETELASANISRFVAGETVGKLDAEIEPSGLINLNMVGPFLDLRPFLEDDGDDESGPKDNPPLKATIAVDAMRTADEESVQYAKLYIDMNGQGNFNQLEMDAIAGSGDLYVRFKPDESGKRVFRLEAEDAGATLKAFQIYDNVIGGKLVVLGLPENGFYDRNLKGEAEMTDFRVVKAPALAKMISFLSLPGAAAMLNNEGLIFTKMATDFEWVFDPDGSVLVLEDGRTSGNSLGLTFEGTFDNAASKIDIGGTIIPLSGVNKVIGKIPLVGDILTGGSGGIFAATYRVKGEGDDPDVSVNPLSVLAPGILRKILFEGSVETPKQ